VIFKGGGPDGLMLDQTVLLNKAFEGLPGGAFGTAAAAGSMAIGLFFAFWSWVGFETTAVYGEESRNPKKIIPRATLIAVIGLGLFYTFISAMVLAGNGAKVSVEASISASPLDLFFGLVESNLGGFLLDVYKILLVIGSFACALAFHNAASRYLFALGREIPSSAAQKTIGAAHPKHGSPYIASTLQSVITLVVVLLFTFFTAVQVPDADGVPVDTPALVPYVNIYGLLALIGTAAILLGVGIAERVMGPWPALAAFIAGSALSALVLVALVAFGTDNSDQWLSFLGGEYGQTGDPDGFAATLHAVLD